MTLPEEGGFSDCIDCFERSITEQKKKKKKTSENSNNLSKFTFLHNVIKQNAGNLI